MMPSSLYASCPGCRENTLVQETAGAWRCAACAFDYGALARDAPAREAWMLENLRRGPMAQLTVLHLHRVLRAMPLKDSNDAVLAFAAQHGIAMPTGRPASPAALAAVVLGALVALLAALYLLFGR
jgi:hypothetical protein